MSSSKQCCYYQAMSPKILVPKSQNFIKKSSVSVQPAHH